MRTGLLLLCVLTLLGGCGPTIESTIPPQEWDGIVFEVQTRPTSLQAGMNEFLILATEKSGRPVHNLVVSLRMDEADPWRQAIQDGHSGVYRRALSVAESATSLSLNARRKKSEDEVELSFPIAVAAP